MRAIQMDLARQPETLENIKKSIDFYSKCSYNFLVLYLEGRIRTKTFHALPENMSYSGEEMREIVDYAGEKGMEVIPVVSFFGHAEHFLESPGMEKFAELRGGIPGRFGSRQHVFCPSAPGVLDFIESYAREVAAIFPSPYFHVGFDEAWDIGYCELCRERMEKEGQSGIFAAHLDAIYKIMKKLGKTMLIWDDLFDIYPEALETTPRDVILCSWHYDALVEKPYGHCGGPRRDDFAKYDKMGFRYLFAPACFSFRNIETFTKYASSAKNILGGLLTVWECPNACDRMPIAYAGNLWSKGEYTPEDAIRETTPLTKEEEFAMVTFFLQDRLGKIPNTLSSYLGGPLNLTEYYRKKAGIAALGILKDHIHTPDSPLEELSIYIESEQIYFALRELLPALLEWEEPNDITEELARIRQRVAAINDRRKAIESRLRPGRESRKNDRVFDQILEFIDSIPNKGPLDNSILRVRYSRPGTPFRFYVRYKDSLNYEEIPGANATGNGKFPGEYFMHTPFDSGGRIPESLRIDFPKGNVGAKIMYAELENSQGRFVPAGIINIEGAVSHPEALLNDGRDTAFFGDGEVQAYRKLREPQYSKNLSSVELLLKKEV